MNYWRGPTFNHYNLRESSPNVWLAHCAKDDFCRQAQWFSVLYFIAAMLITFASVICFLRLPRGRSLSLYCTVQVAVLVALFLSVGAALTFIGRRDKELLSQVMEVNGTSNHEVHVQALVSLITVLNETVPLHWAKLHLTHSLTFG